MKTLPKSRGVYNRYLYFPSIVSTRPFGGLDVALREGITKEAAGFFKKYLYKDGSWYTDYIRIKAVKI